MDYKSSIFTKLVYIVFPVIAFIFNIIILTSTIYRIKEYGISPNSPSHWVDDIVDEDSIYLENYINKRRRKLTLVTYKALEL